MYSQQKFYQALYNTSASRQILEKIDKKLIVDTEDPPDNFQEIADVWGTPMNYEYDPDVDNFPLIISAGPDKTFLTADDINNR